MTKLPQGLPSWIQAPSPTISGSYDGSSPSFCPGTQPALFPKALRSGADIVCVDLEDAVAPADKAAARSQTLALFNAPQDDDGIERIVRINCLRDAFGLADVQALLETDTPPPAVMLPKVRTPDEVAWLDGLLGERGHDMGLQGRDGLQVAILCQIRLGMPRQRGHGLDRPHRVFSRGRLA